MFRSIACACALASLLISSGGCAGEPARPRVAATTAPARQPTQCEAQLPRARELWGSARLESLTEAERAGLLRWISHCGPTLGEKDAIAAARAGVRLGVPVAERQLLKLGMEFKNDAVTVEAFHSLAAGSPVQFSRLESRLIIGAMEAARRLDATGDAELEVHETLLARGFTFPDRSPDDGVRVAHARLLAERGQLDRARERLATVVAPASILTVRTHRVFDPLRADPAFERRLDMRAAAEASLARARAAAAADPRKVDRTLRLVGALVTLGRLDEALAEVERVLVLTRDPESASRLDDLGERVNWLLNRKAQLLYDLDRPVEGRAVFREAIAVGEDGKPNVSQIINFATLLEQEGRPTEALSMLRKVGRASPYGEMWIASVRACAADQLGDTAARRSAIAYLREHERNNVAALARALLCVNDIDGAAALFIRRLRDRSERSDALMSLQVYSPPRGKALPRRAVRADRLARVRDRLDVRAAVEVVGRIEKVPLPVYWVD